MRWDSFITVSFFLKVFFFCLYSGKTVMNNRKLVRKRERLRGGGGEKWLWVGLLVPHGQLDLIKMVSTN